MSTKPNIPEEEVDLGTLFNQIGKMFSNFFNFIGNIFKGIYHYFIIFLLFLRKHVLILGLATLIGAIAGFLLGLNQEPVYESEMEVETAYGSGRNLFKQINYLNTLISELDSIKIGEIFDVPSTEAARLSGFLVEPLDDEKFYFLAYDYFKQNSDTTYTRNITYEHFLNRITDEDLKFYKVKASASIFDIFPKLNNNFIELVENKYYKSLKEKKTSELLFEKEKIVSNLVQIDSLRKRYKEIAYMQFEQKEEENSGVSFRTFNAGYRGNVDLDLYHVSDTLLLKLREVNELLVENGDVIRIQSGFTIGSVKTSILSQKWVRYGLLGFVLSFLFIIGVQFNRYLNKYQRKASL